MDSYVIDADDAITPPWTGQEDALGLAETVTGRVAEAFRLLIALQIIDDASVDQLQKSKHIALLSEMTELLGGQLAMLQGKLAEERRKSQSLETLLRQLIAPRRAA